MIKMTNLHMNMKIFKSKHFINIFFLKKIIKTSDELIYYYILKFFKILILFLYK